MLVLSHGTVWAQEEKMDLTLRLIPGDYHKKVTPGEENILYLEIHNVGNRPITNVRLSSDEPEGWIVKFKPISVDYLSAGSFQTVDVSIKPPGNATRGEYRIDLIAEASEMRKVSSTFLRVETTSSIWFWVGIAVAAVVVAGFIIIYLRFGRQ